MGIATTSVTAAVRQLSDQNSQGTVLGASATDLIGFYGQTTCVARSSVVGAVTLTGASSTFVAGSSFGFSSATVTAAVLNAVNQLKLMGLIN